MTPDAGRPRSGSSDQGQQRDEAGEDFKRTGSLALLLPATLDATPYDECCDFCGATLGRRWTRFRCDDNGFRRTHGPVTIRLRGHWSACKRCAPLVADRQWRRVAARVAARWQATRGPVSPYEADVFRAEMVSMYLELERRLTGAPEPVRRRGAVGHG